MMKEITGVLFDAKSGKAGVKTINAETIDAYYEILECECFDVVTRKIGENYYSIFCDDEGLMKENPIVTAFVKGRSYQPMLVGNLFVTMTDEEGNTISLTNEQIVEVLGSTRFIIDTDSVRTVLFCNY